MNWPALQAARAHQPSQRLPFVIDGVKVGSVAKAHTAYLRQHTTLWPDLQVAERTVTLHTPAEQRNATLAGINAQLREAGLVRGWRDELFTIPDPSSGAVLAHTERAAARFWGTLTRGAHANGYVADVDGRATHLWIAQRALSKATDPGLFDNLVGGGVPAGQTPLQTLWREAWEEAGLQEAQLRAVHTGNVLRLLRDVPEGLQFEDLHGFDIALPADFTPLNQDGEVQGFQCLPLDEAVALAGGGAMTVDAALVTLDFALRHQLLSPDQTQTLGGALHKLFAPPHRRDQMA